MLLKVIFAMILVYAIGCLIYGPVGAVGFVVASAVFGGIGAMPVIILQMAWDMHKDPGLHLWPSVTRCRLCDSRIFVWQSYERRSMQMDVDNPQRLVVGVSGSCLVHTGCEGVPTSKVSVTAT